MPVSQIEQHAPRGALGEDTTIPVRESPFFIDGRWVDGEIGASFEALNPATCERIAAVPDGGADRAGEIADAAARACPNRAAATALEGGAILLKARDVLTARLDALARVVTEDKDKPVAGATREVSCAIQYLPWCAANSEESGQGRRAAARGSRSAWRSSRSP